MRNKEIGTDSLNIKGRRKYKRNDRSQWVPVGNDTPPIVDKQIWEAANRNLKDRNKRPHNSTAEERVGTSRSPRYAEGS